jgi:hypothetical protein
MVTKVAGFTLAILLSGTVWAQSPPNPCRTKPKSESASSKDEKVYDMACATYTGEVIRGPRKVTAVNLNVLRYDYKWNSSVSFQAAPDLWSKLTGVNTTSPTGTVPANPATPTKPGLAGGASIRPDLQSTIDKANKLMDDTEAEIKQILDLKNNIQTDLASLQTQQTKAGDATTQVSNAGKALTDFLKVSTGTPAQLVRGMKDQLADTDANTVPKASQDSTFVVGMKAKWADQSVVGQIRDSSQARASQLDDLKAKFATYVPQQAAALEGSKGELNSLIEKIKSAGKKLSDKDEAQVELLSKVVKNVEAEQKNLAQALTVLDWDTKVNNQILAAVPDLDQGGAKYGTFRAAQDALVTWKRKMENLQELWEAYSSKPDEQPNPFSSGINADCEFAFSRTKQTTITLAQTDLMPGSTSAASTTILSVIVECTSPFTISAGVAFSAIRQKEFAIQPVATPAGSTTTANEFVATNNSSFHPLAIGMVHARVWEPTETLAVHVSLGLAGNFQSQNSGGSSAAFLIGPSLSLFRTMFFTPGVLIAQKAQLGSGFMVGNPAPSNVTTPPLQTSYTAGFGIAITFTKP